MDATTTRVLEGLPTIKIHEESEPNAGGIVHTSTPIVMNGIRCRIEFAESGAPACEHPEAEIGSEVNGDGEFRILPI